MLRRWMSTCALAGKRLCRKLHIRHSTIKDLIKFEKKDASHLSLGIGFIAAYSPNSGNSVWVRPFDCSPNFFGELGAWHHLRISTTDDAAPIILWKVACGRSHVVALTTEGKVYTAGLNNFGQCGYDTTQTSVTPLLFNQMNGLSERISQIVCGLDHTLLLSESGEIFACGWGADGQTGVGGYSDASSPTRVKLPSDLRFTSVYTCADTSFARTSDGLVYGWGNNEYGQLGVATDDPQISTPVHLDLLDLDGRLVSMATGGAFTAFLTSRGSVYLVGYSIEDPSISHDSSSGKLLHPHQMCKLRKIHHGDATKTSDHVGEVHAGLHYLIGEVSPCQEAILWGRDPDSGKEEEEQANGKKLVFQENVQSIAYGPTSVATLLCDNCSTSDNFNT